MLNVFIMAFALVLVIEGMLPFLAPDKWKAIVYQFLQLPNRILRIVGFISMLSGVALLYLVN